MSDIRQGDDTSRKYRLTRIALLTIALLAMASLLPNSKESVFVGAISAIAFVVGVYNGFQGWADTESIKKFMNPRSVGPQGIQGEAGPSGPRGIQGEEGLQGIQGEEGSVRES